MKLAIVTGFAVFLSAGYALKLAPEHLSRKARRSLHLQGVQARRWMMPLVRAFGK